MCIYEHACDVCAYMYACVYKHTYVYECAWMYLGVHVWLK